MNIVIVVALALFLAGGLYHRVTTRSMVLSSNTSLPTPTSTPAVVVPTPTSNPSPTTRPPTPPVTVTVTVTPPSVTSDWQYPGSTQVSAGVYESSDPSDKITDWYESKIRQLGLNIKTFVRTKTNDRVLNKLVAAGKSMEIRVEISKNPSDSVTRIVINY